FPEEYSEHDYWNTLSKKSGIDFSEETAIGQRRSKACGVCEELKFLKSTYTMEIEEDGEVVHIASLWLKDDHAKIKQELEKVEAETMTGLELAELVQAACNDQQKKEKDFEIWLKGKVQGDKNYKVFDKFVENEAYPELN